MTNQDLGKVERLDWRDLGPKLRYMATRRAMRAFRERLAGLPPAYLTLFGSGDYHHLTAALLRRQEGPFSVIVFDQHPDWDVTSPWHCCGSWANEALALPRVQRVVVIGAGRADLHGWHLLRGNTRALRTGRLEIYPYSWKVSNAMGAPRRRASVSFARDGFRIKARWKTVAEVGLEKIVADVLRRLPGPRVYVSIDKDVLRPEFAISNWEAGEMGLDELEAALRQIPAGAELIGADITGEWSAGVPAHPLFRAISRLDHGQGEEPSGEQFAINAATNRRLMQALGLTFLSKTTANS